MNISYLAIREKLRTFQLAYQPHSSLANCAEELFKSSEDLASVQWKQKSFGVSFFCEWRHKLGF